MLIFPNEYCGLYLSGTGKQVWESTRLGRKISLFDETEVNVLVCYFQRLRRLL